MNPACRSRTEREKATMGATSQLDVRYADDAPRCTDLASILPPFRRSICPKLGKCPANFLPMLRLALVIGCRTVTIVSVAGVRKNSTGAFQLKHAGNGLGPISFMFRVQNWQGRPMWQ